MDKTIKPGALSTFKHWTWTGRGRSKGADRALRREKKFSHRAMRRMARTAEQDGVDGPVLIVRGWWA